MKQIIYTCPIPVMWMMKYHNIRFQYMPEHSNVWLEILPHQLKLSLECYGKFRVHPDDVHLYEPKEGDVVKHRGFYGIMSRNNEGIYFIDNKKIPLDDEPIEIVERETKLHEVMPWINSCEVREV